MQKYNNLLFLSKFTIDKWIFIANLAFQNQTPMLSKNKIKLIRSLSAKKNRYESSLFVAEGRKCVDELLSAFECELLVRTDEYTLPKGAHAPKEVVDVTRDELRQASLLEAPQSVLAIFRMRTVVASDVKTAGVLTLALDGVQDAGNMGTIIRLADWFGIENVVCSVGTVDVYNPKCVQATMGALSRVNVCYTDLPKFLKSLSPDVELYSTALNGSNIYESELSGSAVVVMGNEGNGVSAEVMELCRKRLLIPSYPAGRPTSESLNVGVATAIICAEFRRRVLR